MKKTIVVSGILALCLVLFLACAGCTSQSQGTGGSQSEGQQVATTPQSTPQVTATAVETAPAVSDQGLVSNDGSDAVAQAEALNSTQASAPDNADFGDIMP